MIHDIALHTVTTHPDACPACGSAEVEKLTWVGDRRTGIAGRWLFWRCVACDSLFQFPAPSARTLSSYYAKTDSTNTPSTKPSLGNRFDRLRRLYHGLSGDVDPRDALSIPPNARILDYGCGAAPYAVYFQKRGAHVTVVDVAPIGIALQRRQGLDAVLIRPGAPMPFADGAFDVIYLSQVFEHLPEPEWFLDEAHRILAPSGVLLLAYPNPRSVWRSVFGANWVSGWYAPYHLHLYSTAAIQGAARRHGFKVERVMSRTPSSWFQMNLKACLFTNESRLQDARHPLLDSRVSRIVIMIGLRLIELPIRQRDCLLISLQRR